MPKQDDKRSSLRSASKQLGDMNYNSEIMENVDVSTQDQKLDKILCQLAALDIIKNDIREVKAEQLKLNSVVQTVQAAVNTNTKLLNDHENRLNQVEAVNANPPAFVDLNNRFSKLQQLNTVLEEKINKLERYQRNDCIEVVGVPQTEGEDVVKIVMEVADHIGVTIELYEINTAHRIPSNRSEQSLPIIVRFNSKMKKRELLRNKSQLKTCKARSFGDFGVNNDNRIYINEHLSGFNARIYKHTRELAKKKKCTTWTRDGRVFIKLTGGNDITEISSMDDVMRYTTPLEPAGSADVSDGEADRK